MWKWLKNLEKQDKLIIYWACIFLFVIIWIVLKFTNQTLGDFGESLLPNFFADIMNVLAITYLVTYFVQKSQEKKQKLELYTIIGQSFNKLVGRLVKNYLFFVTREDIYLLDELVRREHSQEAIKEIVEKSKFLNITNVIQEKVKVENEAKKWGDSFLKYSEELDKHGDSLENIEEAIYQLMMANFNEDKGEVIEDEQVKKELDELYSEMEILKKNNIFSISARQFTDFYKKYSTEAIKSFSGKYEIVLPHDIKISLFRIEHCLEQINDLIKEDIFFRKKLSREDIQKAENNLLSIGQELLFLMNYFNEIEYASIKAK